MLQIWMRDSGVGVCGMAVFGMDAAKTQYVAQGLFRIGKGVEAAQHLSLIIIESPSCVWIRSQYDAYHDNLPRNLFRLVRCGLCYAATASAMCLVFDLAVDICASKPFFL